MKKLQRLIVSVLALHLLFTGFVAQVHSAMIGTQTVIQVQQQKDALTRIDAYLSRSDVAEQLSALGVSPAQAHERVAALTPDELSKLATQLDELPAGAGALEVIGIVFLVLLILELVGVINIFNRR